MLQRNVSRRGVNDKASGVIASQRVGAQRRPMTSSAKQSRGREKGLDCFVAALLAMT
jgi:hypothetical protein